MDEEVREKPKKDTLSVILYNVVNLVVIAAIMLLKVATIDGTFNIDWIAFGAETAILWIVQYMLFLVNYSIGKDKGKLTELYEESASECRKVCNELIAAFSPSKIQEYCDFITQLDLQNAQRRILSGVCEFDDFNTKYRFMNRAQLKTVPRSISDETAIITAEFAKKLQKRRLNSAEKAKLYLFDRRQINAILRAQKLKAEKMTSSDLIYAEIDMRSRHRVAARPGASEQKQKMRKLFNSAIFAAIFTGVTVSATVDFSFSSVVDMFMSLVPILIGVVNGRVQGYRLSTATAVAYFRAVAAESKAAKKWLDDNIK